MDVSRRVEASRNDARNRRRGGRRRAAACQDGRPSYKRDGAKSWADSEHAGEEGDS